jgi:hypothetical protein
MTYLAGRVGGKATEDGGRGGVGDVHERSSISLQRE